MKELYSFKLNKPEEMEEVEIIKNDQGQEIKQIKKITKEVPKEFFIKKPNRFLFDEAEMFYAIKMSESIKAGMLTRTLMLKKYDDDGGIFTKEEEERIKSIITRLADTQKKLIEIEERQASSSSLSEDKSLKEVLIDDIIKLRGQVGEIENTKNNLFEQTAETRARNKTIVWWILNLAHEKDSKGNSTPLFGEGAYDQKLRKYYELDEEANPFMLKIIDKFTYLISFWYAGKINTPEDFKAVEDYYAER